MAIDVKRLNVLLAVHRTGGVVAAADSLGLTPSAISQHIAKLEAEEGVEVLQRGPRGSTLTAVGLVLAEAAERVEAELVEARKQIATLGPGVSGQVNIGSFQTALRSLVTPTLDWLPEDAPGIDVIVHEVENDDAVRRLRSGDLDIAVVEHDALAGHRIPPGFREVALIDEPWRLALPATMPAPTSLQDLREATWIGAAPGTAAARALSRVVKQTQPAKDTLHTYSSYAVAIDLVAMGQGISLLPALALQKADLEGVDVISLPGLGMRHIAAWHRANRHAPSRAVKTVIDALLTQAGTLDLS